MDKENENISAQADEVEALSAIYPDNWRVIDAATRSYGIDITDGPDNTKYKVYLQVILPPDYPSSAPPQYQLNAPWLRGKYRMDLSNQLEEIFCENIGESILFMWIEKIKEFLIHRADSCGTGLDESLSPSKFSKETDDTDHDHDEESFNAAQMVQFQLEQIEIAPQAAQEVLQCPVIQHGEPLSDRKSTFQAHLAPVLYKQQVQMVMDKLKENKKVAIATHNILAYRIVKDADKGVYLQGCEDDGETQAGSRMLHLMQIVEARNVMVVVTRWYGGVHLGSDRFKHINNCTRSILLEHGYIKDKGEKKGPRSSKKR